MLNKMALMFALLGCVAITGLGACGGDDTTGGGGSGGSGGGNDMAMPVYKIVSGTYGVSALASVEDSCGLGLTSDNYKTIQVLNDGSGNLSLGDKHTPTGAVPQYDPEAYSQGTGTFTDLYHATTTMTTHVTVTTDGACQFDLTRTNTLTVTADNTMNLDFKQMQTNTTAGCSKSYTSCTAHYTYTITKQ